VPAQIVKERDSIGAQLVRRNDEMSLLYEKVKVLEMTMRKGERQYNDRLEDIRLLKKEIVRQRSMNGKLQKQTQVIDDLRLLIGASQHNFCVASMRCILAIYTVSGKMEPALLQA